MAKLKEGNYKVSVKEVYTSSWDDSVTTYVTSGQSDDGETFLQEIADFRSLLLESTNSFINLCSKFDN